MPFPFRVKPAVDLQTRHSLIERVKDPGDQKSWNEFFGIYSPLLYNVARRSGLSEADAEDAVQETFLTVAKSLPLFHYDPALGSFKGWLKQVARSRIVDRWRRERKHWEGSQSLDRQESEGDLAEHASSAFDALWDEQWEQDLLAAAQERVRAKVNARHYQIFQLCVIKGSSVAAVAKLLQLRLHQVYFARAKVIKLIQAEVKRLEQADM
jgi:RNA polymerase sigma factor (sigma-70 family)